MADFYPYKMLMVQALESHRRATIEQLSKAGLEASDREYLRSVLSETLRLSKLLVDGVATISGEKVTLEAVLKQFEHFRAAHGG